MYVWDLSNTLRPTRIPYLNTAIVLPKSIKILCYRLSKFHIKSVNDSSLRFVDFKPWYINNILNLIHNLEVYKWLNKFCRGVGDGLIKMIPLTLFNMTAARGGKQPSVYWAKWEVWFIRLWLVTFFSLTLILKYGWATILYFVMT